MLARESKLWAADAPAAPRLVFLEAIGPVDYQLVQLSAKWYAFKIRYYLPKWVAQTVDRDVNAKNPNDPVPKTWRLLAARWGAKPNRKKPDLRFPNEKSRR